MKRIIKVTLERKDYIALFLMLINKRMTLLASLPLIVAIPVGAVLLGYISGNSGIPYALLFPPYLFLILVMLLIFLRTLVSPALRQFDDARRSFGNAFTFLLDGDGFICSGGHNEAEYSYARLTKALETKSYIFLFVSDEQACILPKRMMDEGELEFLRGILPKCAVLSASELSTELDSSEPGKASAAIPLESSNDPLS